MKLYHFCSKKHISSIKSQGLTLGSIPVCNFAGVAQGLIRDHQWLTANPVFGEQEWQSNGTIKYNRNDYRIEVAIPKAHRDRLHRWEVLCEQIPELRYSARTLNAFGDPENWYVFEGRVKPGWFRQIAAHPERDLKV